jgi:hypothetical protein
LRMISSEIRFDGRVEPGHELFRIVRCEQES